MIVLLGIGLALAAIAGCGKSGGPGGGPGERVVHVVGFRAVEQPVEERMSVVGTLAANESVELKSEVDGAIEEIGFEEGEPVTENTVLFRIDRRKLEASLAEAEANLKFAETTLDRYAALAQSRAVSQQEVDQARTAFEARRASVELMRAQLEDATVTAPFSGTMGSRLVSIGQYVTKGQLLTSLVDTSHMKVACDVPERFLGQLAQGQQVIVRVAAYPEETFRGTVYFVDPTVNPQMRTVLIKARLLNPEGRLRPGMFANLTVTTQVRKNAVVVPETALMLQGRTTSVFVVNDEGMVEARQVQAGVRLAGLVEIASGLAAGETVIIEGVQKVYPGAKVSVRYDERPEGVS